MMFEQMRARASSRQSPSNVWCSFLAESSLNSKRISRASSTGSWLGTHWSRIPKSYQHRASFPISSLALAHSASRRRFDYLRRSVAAARTLLSSLRSATRVSSR